MVEPTLITELENDLSEFSSLATQAQRSYVKLFLDKEISRIKDLILIEKNKVVQKTEEKNANFVSQDNFEYIAIKSYSWEQEGKVVKVYLALDGIGDVSNESISCEFEDQSFDLKIKGYRNQNLRFAVKKLNNLISKEGSRFVIKKNSIHISLSKKESKTWDNLYFKESQLQMDDKPEGKEKEDPQESLMNMMKKLYQEGDDQMKKTIAQAWTKSQEEKDKKAFK